MKKLSMTRLRTIQLLVPPIHEQDAAIKISRILDSEALSLSRQLHALRRLKRGLMQKLLTGELEVPTAKNRTTTEVPA